MAHSSRVNRFRSVQAAVRAKPTRRTRWQTSTTLSADGVTRYGANQLPAGLAFSADGKSLYAAINLTNRLAEIDLAKNRIVREIPVGNAPYDVALVRRRAYVSNFGGRIPAEGGCDGARGTRHSGQGRSDAEHCVGGNRLGCRSRRRQGDG